MAFFSTLLSAYFAALSRDLLLVMRRKTEVLTALFFFVIVTTLLPLGIGPEPDLLRKIAPGAMWIAALLATLLGLQRLFAADHADGTLEQMALSPEPLSILVAVKSAHTGSSAVCRWCCWHRSLACSSICPPMPSVCS